MAPSSESLLIGVRSLLWLFKGRYVSLYNNGQIWADAVGGKFTVSLKAMAKSFGFTQIIMQEYVHKIARPVVLSDTFFYINACSQMVCITTRH